MFILISMFSLSIGSSLGSITAFMPIAYGIAQTLHINPALMAALVVSGSMLGDNLSVISDTSIAATRATHCKMRDKFTANLLIALPAFVCTIAILFYITKTGVYDQSAAYNTALVSQDYINVIPYFFVFLLSVSGVDVLAVLACGALVGAIIGIWQNKFSFFEATSFIFEGFYGQKSMVRILILFLFISGLSKIIEHNGGFRYLLNKLGDKARNGRHAQLLIVLITILVNATIAINTLSIVLVGSITKEIGDRFDIPGGRVACLLDVAATSTQGFLPYAPMLLLTSSLAHVSTFEIMKYLTYQPLLFLSMLVSIFLIKYPKK